MPSPQTIPQTPNPPQKQPLRNSPMENPMVFRVFEPLHQPQDPHGTLTNPSPTTTPPTPPNPSDPQGANPKN